jgi:hypothetical protein
MAGVESSPIIISALVEIAWFEIKTHALAMTIGRTCSQAWIKNWTGLRQVNGINGSCEMAGRNIRRHGVFIAPKTALSGR